MIEKPSRTSLVVGLLCLALATSACAQRGMDDRVTASGGEPASASAAGDNGNGTYNAPDVPSGPAIFVAQGTAYSAYNDTTAATTSISNTEVLNQVLAAPFIVDGNGNFLLNADVMVSAELTSRDPQVVTYRIKPDVTWSDGAPFDCRDFYLAWLAHSGKAVARGPDGKPILDAQGKESDYFRPATTLGYHSATGECRDAHTFVETYSAPYVEWRRNYIQNAVLPAHVLERMAGVSDIAAIGPQSAQPDLKKVADVWNTVWNGFNADTMPASGPYRIESSQPDGRTVLVRNDKWAGKPGGPDRIVFTPAAGDAAEVDGLQHRNVNVVVPGADPVLADRLRALSGRGVVFEARGGPTTDNLELNLARPLFQDVDVRTAFAQCIDRNKLVDDLVRGVNPTAQPQGSLVFLPDSGSFEDQYTDKMPADPRQAQLTLERDGWILGADGVYSRNEQRLSFTISHDGSPTSSRAVELIRGQCRQAGMEIIDRPTPAGFGVALAQGTYDVALTTDSLIPRISSLAERYGSKGEKNFQHYVNPHVDDALEVAQTEYGQPVQVAALQKADKLIAADLVSFPLFQIPVMWAHSDNLGNVFLHNTAGVTWNANEWRVNQR
ncbi:MAG TPA: ABC transporter substrate-binding protein [Pseudonocardiaceae bacterium]